VKNQIARDIRKHLLFKTPYFICLTYKLDNPLDKGSILDIETTGIDPLSDKIITLGIIRKNFLLIYQLIKEDSYWRFLQLCKRIAKKQPTPRYAYSSHFEADFLNLKDDKWLDLTQYFEVDYDYENPFRRYSLIDVTRHPFPNEPIDIDGSQIPTEWQEYLKTKNKIHLTNITYHSACDLLRTKQLVDTKDIKLNI